MIVFVSDATSNWRTNKTAFGVYIVRSVQTAGDDKVRIGVGGIRGGSLYGRLSNHCANPPKELKYATHRFQPYTILKAWHLIQWSRQQLEDAEMCLYRAFLVRYPRHDDELADKSIFNVAKGDRLSEVIAEIENDLRRIASFNGRAVDVIVAPTAKSV